ncbi:MAG: OmpH family outer membrane protein [Phycisphaerales bacterium]|nr:OmpH family outer membrane protein [Phycisphaerales bacterium]
MFSKMLVVLNILLLCVVFYLIVYLNKHENNNGNQSWSNSTPVATNNKNGHKSTSLAYFVMDSIENRFEYFKSVRNQLHEQELQINNYINHLKLGFKRDYEEYQNKASKMSPAEDQAMQQKLYEKDKYIQAQVEYKNQELSNNSFVKLQDVRKKIDDFLKEYNKNKRYAYIVSANPDVFYLVDSANDISTDLINGLNARYKVQK